MPEVYDELRSAAAQFKTATAHFQNAEESLYNLEARLEDCLKRLRKLTPDEPLEASQPGRFFREHQHVNGKKMNLVGSMEGPTK